MNKEPGCLMAACEILWDCFPDGNRLGGATFNVAYHLNQLRVTPGIIASVGRDELGDQALRVIEQEWACDTEWIRRLDDVPTGRVTVTLDAKGDATYDVLTPAAWDRVEIPEQAVRGRTCPLLYPSVGLRSEFNRDQIRRTLAGYEGLKCFDANLRPPHNSPEIVMEFAALADFVKVNEEELGVLIVTDPAQASDLESRMVALARILGVDRLCVTRADQPAAMLTSDRIFYGAAYPTVVQNTVGAGDAFMAAMIASLSQPSFDPVAALSRASALGSWVASKPGAQPPYDGSQPSAHL